MKTTITANGIAINYRLDGPAGAPVVMLSNSLMSNYTMWDDQVSLLAGTYRVLRYDQRGHGGTEVPVGSYSIEQLTTDAVALIEALGIAAVHFVGLSMGGFTGQLMAMDYPDKVLSLCLCDTACVMPPSSLWQERIDIARRDGVAALMPATLERWFTKKFRESGDPRLEKVREMIIGTDVEGYIGCAAAIRDMDLCGKLAEISAPTRVIVGADDPACPPAYAQTLHQGIAGSSLVVLPDAAHLPNIEQTELFNEALREFLAGVA
ncbi:MAG: 3-oxoadipate enol-lactonase [Desulfobulbaceae bacterium]|nr:3-oxoadipate enol-lactonase [Desulfobulbaceae bacterium]